MSWAFITSAIVTVVPTLTIGYANGITALGLFGMLVTGFILHMRNKAKA